MHLTQISGGNCERNDCPTVFATDRGTVVVQGYILHSHVPSPYVAWKQLALKYAQRFTEDWANRQA